ncbi:hypothetical protein GGR02_000783 [Anoxybacillus voinovskiensis]|uniref:Uncharacterized protein n=1 Tax=Anoxybacteroides voinovskiense TaxID=230470 RepID=A0A840DNG4_9BACL|nr:hypothetical protein [Anoxybacillus voinovskiensis]MBB4073022.1 hypothetical protein [Anoxybacillus voinovskiensis]GGJ60017.1 hypothetical protein GCM10008982_06440 [Anoxybacillus voinovskiensis]
MRRMLVWLLIGNVCGYLMISWAPVVTPFVWTNFITDFTFHPLRSFLAMVCFFVGFVANAAVVRTFLEEALCLLVRKPVRWQEWGLSVLLLPSFYWLFQLNERLTLLFFLFSVAYGMISIDLADGRRYKIR